MGCIVIKAFDPAPPNNVVDVWHVNGVLIDITSNDLSNEDNERVQQYSAGVLYVFNSRLIYRPRHCTFSRNNKLLQFEICDMQNINSFNKFTSKKDGRTFARSVVDITVNGTTPSNMHIGFVSKEADKIAKRLEEICQKHKAKPKIFQFNSIDVEGVELL
ncbi:hypothetical protein M3Y97_00868800 [Aphelenchoides bicaudatus]|nr:hypothetical protein M3Y97_00868800 [Aphelenchoides bicaudatus]